MNKMTIKTATMSFNKRFPYAMFYFIYRDLISIKEISYLIDNAVIACMFAQNIVTFCMPTTVYKAKK